MMSIRSIIREVIGLPAMQELQVRVRTLLFSVGSWVFALIDSVVLDTILPPLSIRLINQ